MSNVERVPIKYAQPLRPMPEHWRTPSIRTIEDFQRSRGLGEVATHHPALHKRADAIPEEAIQSRATRELVDQLKHASDGELEAGRSLVGLAAPQIGVSRRVFLANYSMDKDLNNYDPTALTVMINPKLTVAENSRTSKNPEGCYSCGPLAGIVERPIDVHAAWTDIRGKKREETFQAFGSVVLGHENDHLDGILFPDRTLAQGRLIDWVDPEQTAAGEYGKAVRAGESWEAICSVDQWEAMKRPDTEGGPIFRLEAFALPGQQNL